MHYAPFTNAGRVRPGLTITKVEHGTCTHRPDDERTDMFDCTVPTAHGSNEDSPCFYGGPHAPELICPTNFRRPQGYEIVPTPRLPPPPGPVPATSQVPFALTLTNGRDCIRFPIRSRPFMLQGLAPTYICPATDPVSLSDAIHRHLAAVYGTPDTTGNTWTVHYSPHFPSRDDLTTLPVSTAWY